MLKRKWRVFRPKKVGRLQDKTFFETDSIYAKARVVVDTTLTEARSTSGENRFSEKNILFAVKKLQQKNPQDVVYLLAKIILMTPNSAKAQTEMDAHRGGYRNRKARLFELIDFNDVFVDLVLRLDKGIRQDFEDRLYEEMQVFCEKVNLSCFTREQYDSIAHGLSREIAVYLGARKLGYIAHMSSRDQDAYGVDMVVTDPTSKKSIKIDVKTRSAFHFRLKNLSRRQKISEEKRMYCELSGYCKIIAGHKQDPVEAILLRVATIYMGEIKAFEFTDIVSLGSLLRSAINDYGRYS